MRSAGGMTPRIRTVAGALVVATLMACSRSGAADVRLDVAGAGESVRSTSTCAAESIAAGAVRVARDVAYLSRADGTLDYDIAWSEAGPAAPLVVLLHGGSWSGGSPASLEGEMQALARRGYTVATVEYRLTSGGRNVFPAAAADVRCAIRTLRRRAAGHHADPARVAVMGYSAGGHLASLLGVGADQAALEPAGDACEAGRDGHDVQAVVSYAGPQDLRANGRYTRKQARIVTNFLGVFPGDAPALATLASPIAHVGQGDPPFLLLHGTRDDLVPLRHARRMQAALRAAGTPASLVELPGKGHAFAGFVTSEDDRVRCTVDAFLARWLRG